MICQEDSRTFKNIAIMNSVEFTKWINEKFIEWRGNSRFGVTDFANYVGVSQPLMSRWLNGRSKRMPDSESIAKLADKFPDVYEAVGLPAPKPKFVYLPRELRRNLERAQEETEHILRERNLTGEDPEAEKIAIEIFEKHGFKYISTTTEPD